MELENTLSSDEDDFEKKKKEKCDQIITFN